MGSSTHPIEQQVRVDFAPLLKRDDLLAKHRSLIMDSDAKVDEIELESALPKAENGSSTGSGYHLKGTDQIVDFVLAYNIPSSISSEKESAKQAELKKIRETYEQSLRDAGLILEEEKASSAEEPESEQTDSTPEESTCCSFFKAKATNSKVRTHFVLIHVPWEVLTTYAELMLMKMPIQENDIDIKTWPESVLGADCTEKIASLNPFQIANPSILPKPTCFVAYFNKANEESFLINNKSTFFTRAQRSLIAHRICQQASFGEDDLEKGIEKLLHSGVYTAAYPLHDGPLGQGEDNDRQCLREDWASFKRIGKYQPLDAIKDYFGPKVALYFAWLGMYTWMLVPAAIVGLIAFIYGVVTSVTYPPVEEVCNTTLEQEKLFFMCPLCDKKCSYWSLTQTCSYVRVAQWFDNEFTVFFAIFMSVWATLFIEFWKRKQANLSYKWHMSDYEDAVEQPRPEYLATVTTLKCNPVTNRMEPHIPKLQRYMRYTGAASAVLFMICLVLAAVIGVIVYRAAVFAALNASDEIFWQRRSRTITSGTAALINLICINLLKFLYQKLAFCLTNWENPRTQTAYEDSFTMKMYLFQFINTYSSIIYIAFFKVDLLVGTPGNYRRFFGKKDGFRLEGCSASGCLIDLCIQLFVIMVGQQVIGNVTELFIPTLMKWWKQVFGKGEAYLEELPAYEREYKLSALPPMPVFWQYMEIVLQYGFVTMFVAAFPLAPLFALINNAIEIRLDATNFVVNFRRAEATPAQDIGIWLGILESMGRFSVLVNAFVISITSSFVPKLVYKMKYSPDGSLYGYVNNGLSYINITDLQEEDPNSIPENPYEKLNYTMPYCRYWGWHYTEPPFEFTKQHWHIISAKLAFVFCFQYTVYLITSIIAYLVPDKPRSLDLRMKREAFLASQVGVEKKLSSMTNNANTHL